MSENKNFSLFDKRVVERNIKRGLITKKEYDTFLNELLDSEEEVSDVDVRFIRKNQTVIEKD